MPKPDIAARLRELDGFRLREAFPEVSAALRAAADQREADTQEIKSLRHAYNVAVENMGNAISEAHGLRATLAARDALLRRAMRVINQEADHFEREFGVFNLRFLAAEIAAALESSNQS